MFLSLLQPGKDPTPSHPLPAGWGTLWCLQDRKFLKKFGCDEGRREFPSKADAGVGSQTLPWLVKEEVQDKPELTENPTHSETLPLHPMTEQQSLDPWEQLWERNPGNTQTNGHTLGETTLLPKTWKLRVEDLRAAVAKDHSYCLRGELAPRRGVPKPHSLREHDYCCQHRATRSPVPCALCRRLARHRPGCARTIRRAREIVRRYRPYRRVGIPWRGCSTCCRMNRSAGNAQGVTLDARGAPEGILGIGGSLPALSQVGGMRKRVMSLKDSSARQESGGCVKARKSQGMSLQDVFQDVLKAVGYILDSMCRKFELQGFSQGKSIWPIIIQIDNLTELGKS